MDTEIKDNNIQITGHKNAYALSIDGENIILTGNIIESKSDSKATGIKITANSNGIIENNDLKVVSPEIACGIIYNGLNSDDELIINNNNVNVESDTASAIIANNTNALITNNNLNNMNNNYFSNNINYNNEIKEGLNNLNNLSLNSVVLALSSSSERAPIASLYDSILSTIGLMRLSSRSECVPNTLSIMFIILSPNLLGYP